MVEESEKERPIIIINKKGGHGGHHGGAWKVAYADFITSMMAFFLVMWLVSQDQIIKDNVAQYFNDPIGFGKGLKGKGSQSILKGGESILKNSNSAKLNTRAITEERAKEVLRQAGEKITDALSGMPNFEAFQDHIEIDLTEEGLRIELIESLSPTNDSSFFFRLGESELSATGKEVIIPIAKELGKLNNKVIIEGHTDARQFAYGRIYSNWELSADRANAARKFMTANGLKDKQIEGVMGYAANRLKFPDNPLDARNRRVSILVLRDLSEHQIESMESHEIIDGNIVVD
ncbi:MAG: OmpA family protein [candidate division Zixibacteria bacterium]|nr:OmpA family protein [candidate division Zixibacteria bacterium]